ncbi:MAG TPA: maleylpyruvate isomerase N-terminal domain-containing protein [Acidimicrobiales bacterium]|nr:maleylpyruvate isomerase N-terminal domain-containing protein [Acidimicrobiales bacterium]
MDYDAHVAATATALDAYRRALTKGPLDAHVPTCPEFDLAALTKHVGEFCGFWGHVVCEALGRDKTPFDDFPGSGPATADWFDQLARDLVMVLREATPETPSWTWIPDRQNVAFIARRCAHELAIHRYDAQLAVGTTESIDAETAADGIDEIFVMHAALERARNGNGESLHLHSAEGHEWVITLSPDGMVVDRTHGKADVALRGATSDIELTLYQRPTIGEVEVLGDRAALDAWYRCFTFG